MSNYHVESIDKPAALSSEAIKALRAGNLTVAPLQSYAGLKSA